MFLIYFISSLTLFLCVEFSLRSSRFRFSIGSNIFLFLILRKEFVMFTTRYFNFCDMDDSEADAFEMNYSRFVNYDVPKVDECPSLESVLARLREIEGVDTTCVIEDTSPKIEQIIELTVFDDPTLDVVAMNQDLTSFVESPDYDEHLAAKLRARSRLSRNSNFFSNRVLLTDKPGLANTTLESDADYSCVSLKVPASRRAIAPTPTFDLDFQFLHSIHLMERKHVEHLLDKAMTSVQQRFNAVTSGYGNDFLDDVFLRHAIISDDILFFPNLYGYSKKFDLLYAIASVVHVLPISLGCAVRVNVINQMLLLYLTTCQYLNPGALPALFDSGTYKHLNLRLFLRSDVDLFRGTLNLVLLAVYSFPKCSLLTTAEFPLCLQAHKRAIDFDVLDVDRYHWMFDFVVEVSALQFTKLFQTRSDAA